MAKDPSLLTSSSPSAIVNSSVQIGHVQLRDLIICPRERGVVNYIQPQAIVELDLRSPNSTPRTLVELQFTPNTLTSLPILGTDDVLVAAGGQEAEVHLSLHSPGPSRHRRTTVRWNCETQMQGSINNSVLLTSLNLTRSNQSAIEPRVGISNNDCTVKFYDVPLSPSNSKRVLKESGSLRLDVPVNHSSISPDGQTLLSVGDSSKVYLHRITGGARIDFSHTATLVLPPPDFSPLSYPSSSLAASFSTAFSSDGTKFVVGSQEGVVAVWDVRSTKPLKVFQTDKSRLPGGNGGATGWLSDDPWEWTRGNSKAPGWSVRSVKFGCGGDGRSGKEIMAFTEHTSLLHIIDARTFETEEIIRVPTLEAPISTTPPFPPPVTLRPHLHPQRLSSIRSSPPMPSPLNPNPSSPTRPVSNRRNSTQSQRRHPILVQALEDTFRISASPPNEPSWQRYDPRANIARREEILVIPPMGDQEVETGVQALLSGSSSSGRRRADDDYDDEGETDLMMVEDLNTGSAHGDYEYNPNTIARRRWYIERAPGGRLTAQQQQEEDMEMDIDELEESECAESGASRSSSPAPSMQRPARTHQQNQQPRPLEVFDDDLDLAGMCFDPSGACIYVGSTGSVAEWTVRGSEKRWWVEAGWA